MITTTTATLYNRKVSLDIQVGDVIKTYEANEEGYNLKIDFNIIKTMGNLGDRGEITITGLSLDDINSLSSCMLNIGETPPQRNYVSLSAGYSGDYGVIFTGGVYTSRPQTNSPDMSITLELKPGFDKSRTIEIEVNEKNTTLSAMAQKCASALECPLVFSAEDKTYTDYNFKGSVFQLLENLQRSVPYSKRIYFSDSTVYVEDLATAGSNVINISGDSGMIGDPEVSMQGVSFKCLLMPSLAVGLMVNLTSRKLPLLNGLYKITNLKMVGSNRETQYYCECFCVRM